MSRYRVGIEIGGTFTDFSVLNEQGAEVFNSKFLSTLAVATATRSNEIRRWRSARCWMVMCRSRE